MYKMKNQRKKARMIDWINNASYASLLAIARKVSYRGEIGDYYRKIMREKRAALKPGEATAISKKFRRNHAESRATTILMSIFGYNAIIELVGSKAWENMLKMMMEELGLIAEHGFTTMPLAPDCRGVESKDIAEALPGMITWRELRDTTKEWELTRKALKVGLRIAQEHNGEWDYAEEIHILADAMLSEKEGEREE